MNRLLAATILVFIGVSVLRAELETTTNAPPSVIVLEGMIRSISPPVVWPDSNRHILEIPEFVASNGIPSDVFAATFARVAEERIARYADPAYAKNKSGVGVWIAVVVGAMGDIGNTAFLPWLERQAIESTLPNVKELVSRNYVKTAGLDAVPFVRRILSASDETYDFGCKAGVAKEFFDQITKAESTKAPKERIDAAYAILVEQALNEQKEDIAWELDKRLSQHLPEYKTSRQRNVVLSHFMQSTNEVARGLFTQRFNELQRTPKAERIDLRTRFPDLAVPIVPDGEEETEDKPTE